MFDPIIEEQRPWDPLTPSEIFSILKGTDFKWWIAGGYAIENFVGRSFREHGDIDILICRSCLNLIRDTMSDWKLYPSDPPGRLRVWQPDETLPNTVRDIWGRKDDHSPWSFQIMVNDCENEEFLYKRDPSIRFNIKRFTQTSSDGIPFLAPELQLLYKGKSPREKDNKDFELCLPLLRRDERLWLKEMLIRCYSAKHPWLDHFVV